MITRPNASHGSLRSYTVGFILSIGVTAMAYLVVVHHIFSSNGTVVAILALAILQLVVQLVFFLHLTRESNPRWNLLTLSFMMIVVVILVLGSVWIMKNLNYNTMTSQQIIQSEAITR
jgi:cytochrome o ubiquinol oxidase operon protein cyoD